MGQGVGRGQINPNGVLKASHIDLFDTAPALAGCASIVDEYIEPLTLRRHLFNQGF